MEIGFLSGLELSRDFSTKTNPEFLGTLETLWAREGLGRAIVLSQKSGKNHNLFSKRLKGDVVKPGDFQIQIKGFLGSVVHVWVTVWEEPSLRAVRFGGSPCNRTGSHT